MVQRLSDEGKYCDTALYKCNMGKMFGKCKKVEKLFLRRL